MLKTAFSCILHLYISYSCKASVPLVTFVIYGYLTHHENGAHTKYWLLLCFQSAVSKCDTNERNDQCLVQISSLDLLLYYGSYLANAICHFQSNSLLYKSWLSY